MRIFRSLLGFYSLLTLGSGTQRRIAQVVRVVDQDLLQRLHVEVKPGDEIRVSTEVDPTVPDCPTVLKDLHPVSTLSEGLHARGLRRREAAQPVCVEQRQDRCGGGMLFPVGSIYNNG
jgi:hypothetical protein